VIKEEIYDGNKGKGGGGNGGGYGFDITKQS
jgi:hypothetical protein